MDFKEYLEFIVTILDHTFPHYVLSQIGRTRSSIIMEFTRSGLLTPIIFRINRKIPCWIIEDAGGELFLEEMPGYDLALNVYNLSREHTCGV